MKVPGVVKAASLLIWLSTILGPSLFCGLMIATAGGALYTPLYRVAAPLACDGEFTIESRRYSYKPGQTGVEHKIFCKDNASGTRTEITLYAAFIAFLIYSGLIFIGLLVITAILILPIRLLTRRLKPAAGYSTSSHAGSPIPGVTSMLSRVMFRGREYSGPDEMASGAQAAYEQAISVFDDAGRNGMPDLSEGTGQRAQTPGDTAERLKKLKGLLEAGLITEQEYQAKKAEILSEL